MRPELRYQPPGFTNVTYLLVLGAFSVFKGRP